MSDEPKMTREEWEATVQRHNEAQARRAGVMNSGERQVRDAYEAQIPALPPEVQRRWDAWADARCKEMIESALGDLSDFLGKEFGKFDARLDKSNKEFADEIAKLKKDLNTKIIKMRKDVVATRSTNVIDLPNPIVRKQQ
jgi:hypothetical protein